MKRREFSIGLATVGLMLPAIAKASVGGGDGQSAILGRLRLEFGDGEVEPENVVYQNAEIRGWRTKRELEITANGNSYRIRATAGLRIGSALFAGNSLYFMNPNHYELPPYLRILKGQKTFKVPRKMRKLDPGLKLSASLQYNAPTVGTVYADSKYTYLDIKPGF